MELLVLLAMALVFVGGAVRTWPRRSTLPPELALPPYTYHYEPEFPDPPKEPWRDGPYGDVAVVVGVEILAEIADRRRLQELGRIDSDYLLDLEADIKAKGVEEPLILVVDAMGRLCMKEGHHRTIVAGRIGMTGLPVRFRSSEGRVSYGRPLSETVERLLQSVVRELQ